MQSRHEAVVYYIGVVCDAVAQVAATLETVASHIARLEDAQGAAARDVAALEVRARRVV